MKRASIYLAGTLLLSTATAFSQSTNEGTLNVTLSEPQRNCPTLTVRATVTNLSGTRVRGLSVSSFILAENQTQLEATVEENAPGEYALTFSSLAQTLRINLNVGVVSTQGRGFGSILTTSCALRVSCSDLPHAMVGQPYQAQLHYTVPAGFSQPFLSISPATSLLRVDSSTGQLNGQFATPGNFDFTAFIAIVEQSSTATFTAQQSCQIRIDLPPITFTDISPKSGTACGPGFPIVATGTNFLRPQGNVGSFITFDSTQLSGGTLSADGTTLTYNVPEELLRQFRSSAIVNVTTRSAGIPAIESGSRTYTFRPTPGFAANFNTTSLQASSPTGTTPLNVDVLNLDAGTTRLRITVGSASRLLTARSIVGGRLVFDVPNDLIALGGSATITLVNADESNPTGTPYTRTCATNSFRTLTLGPATATISSLSPRSATACGPAFGLTVNGSSFATNSGVEFDGSALPNPQLANGSITVQIGTAQLGTAGRTAQVRVTTPGGNPSAPEAFVIRSAPRITSISVSNFALNGGDQTVTATGTDFVAGVTKIRWAQAGAIPVVLDTTVQSPTQLTITIPGRLLTVPGSVALTIVNADEANPTATVGTAGGQCPAPVSAVVSNPPAVIRSLDPSSEIAARTTPLSVTINGAGFLEGAEVLVNGTVQTGATFVSATQIRVPLTAAQLASPGPLQITVRNPNSAASSPTIFQVLAVPVGRITISSNPAAPATAQDLTLSIAQSEASPRQLRATLALTFEANADNIPASGLPAAALPVFAAGGTSFSFDLAGDGALPAGALVRPGTVSGTVVVRMTALTATGSSLNLLPSPAPEVRIVIPKTAPVIESARIIANTGGFDLEILAFSPVRNVTNAVIQVNPVSGTRTEGDTRFTVDLTSRFNDWYRDAANLQFGSQFRLRIPFTLANGDASAIESVTVTLTNSIGTSSSATGRR